MQRGENQVKQPNREGSQAVEEVLGAAFHMKFLALLCHETPFLLQNHQYRLLCSYFFLVELRNGLSSYTGYITCISTCRNL